MLLRAVAITTLCALLHGCGSAPSSEPSAMLAGPPTKGEIESREELAWADLDKAVGDALTPLFVATDSVESLGDAWRVYHLRDNRGRHGRLDIRRIETGFDVQCKFGRFGDPELERSIIRAVRKAVRQVTRARP